MTKQKKNQLPKDELYKLPVTKREARFEVVDRLREKAPVVPEEEVLNDVTEAIAAVRAGR